MKEKPKDNWGYKGGRVGVITWRGNLLDILRSCYCNEYTFGTAYKKILPIITSLLEQERKERENEWVGLFSDAHNNRIRKETLLEVLPPDTKVKSEMWENVRKSEREFARGMEAGRVMTVMIIRDTIIKKAKERFNISL
jgi:hypothetical protein